MANEMTLFAQQYRAQHQIPESTKLGFFLTRGAAKRKGYEVIDEFDADGIVFYFAKSEAVEDGNEEHTDADEC